MPSWDRLIYESMDPIRSDGSEEERASSTALIDAAYDRRDALGVEAPAVDGETLPPETSFQQKTYDILRFNNLNTEATLGRVPGVSVRTASGSSDALRSDQLPTAVTGASVRWAQPGLEGSFPVFVWATSADDVAWGQFAQSVLLTGYTTPESTELTTGIVALATTPVQADDNWHRITGAEIYDVGSGATGDGYRGNQSDIYISADSGNADAPLAVIPSRGGRSGVGGFYVPAGKTGVLLSIGINTSSGPVNARIAVVTLGVMYWHYPVVIPDLSQYKKSFTGFSIKPNSDVFVEIWGTTGGTVNVSTDMTYILIDDQVTP